MKCGRIGSRMVSKNTSGMRPRYLSGPQVSGGIVIKQENLKQADPTNRMVRVAVD